MKKKFQKGQFSIPQRVINQWNLEEVSQCVCYQKTSNIELLYLIEQFLKQIKNLLFLDLNKNILDYYGKFDQILKEKQLNLGKFSYVEKLFSFYRENQDQYFFNQSKFEDLLLHLITKELCIHDYKIIVQFLEGFKNVRFIENFANFLNQHHQNVAHQVFRKIFFKSFFSRFEKISEEIMSKIVDSNFFHLENSPLVHLLGPEVLKLDKKLSFHLFQRFRYYLLIDPNFKSVFQIYFTEQELTEFKRLWLVYNLIVNLVRKDVDSLEFLKPFVKESLTVLRKEMTVPGQYFMKVLAAFYLIKFEAHNKEKIKVKILEFIENCMEVVSDENKWLLALLTSNVSNLLFKNQMMIEAIPLKKQSLQMAKEAQKLSPEELSKELQVQEFEAKSYDLMFSLLQKDQKDLGQKLQAFREQVPFSRKLQIEHNLIQCFYFKEIYDEDSFQHFMKQTKNLLSQQEDFVKDLYQAMMNAILL